MPNNYTFQVVDLDDLVSSSIEASISECAQYVIGLISRYIEWKGTIDFVVEIRPNQALTWSDADGLLPSIVQTVWDGNAWRNATLAECLTGFDPDPGRPDAGCTIYLAEDGTVKNYGFPLWFDPDPAFGTDPAVPAGMHDFVGILTHEIFHSLGFITYTKEWTDRLVTEGGISYFTGATAAALYGGAIPFASGSDHYGYTQDPSIPIGRGLMYQWGNYERNRLDIGRIDLAILADLGYTIKTYDGLSLFEMIDTAPDLTGGPGADRLYGDYHDNSIAGGSGDDRIEGGGGADLIFGDAGADTILGDDGDDVVQGGGEGDTIDGGAGDDVLRGEDGDDRLAGGAGDDLLRGGAGVDSFDGGADDGAISSSGLIADRISFFEVRATEAVVADLRTGIISNDGFGNVETMTGIESFGADTAFADSFYGNDGDNGFFVGRGDLVHGFGGDDLVEARAAPAVLNGGAGTDLLQVYSDGGFLLPDSNGDGTAEASAAMTAGWTVDLAAGTVRDGFGNVGTVTGVEHLVGSALADRLRGDAGANRLDGGGGRDVLLLQDGGEDSASGGEGSDLLYFGAALTAGDVADGGDGRDALVLQGNVTAVLGAAQLVGIESISLQTGANPEYGDTGNNRYDYDLTMADGNVAAGQQLIVNAQSLLMGEDFAFDGSAESDGSFRIYGGHGVDTLTGGDGNDIFFFEGQRWGADDRVHGGEGRDSLVISAGGGVNHIAFVDDSFTSIESISLNNKFATDPTQKPSYELVLANGNVAAGATLIVNASSIAAGQFVSIDGSAVHDGNLRLFGGAGNDTLKGGDGADTLVGGGGSDSLTGGAGADVFRFDAMTDSTAASADVIVGFQSGVDKIDLSRLDANSNAAGDQAFAWIGGAAFHGVAGELRAYDVGSTRWIEGDTDGDGDGDFAFMFQTVTPLEQSDFLL